MEKEKVVEYFNEKAKKWDEKNKCDDGIIKIILDNAEFKVGDSVLDVACGTGIMIPYYLEREAGKVTAIDISVNMIEIAKEKFKEMDVEFILGDVEEYCFGELFDRIVIYNAFPHFPNPKSIVKCLSGLLKEGGTLTIAHGMSREDIDSHHRGGAAHISNGLMEADDLEKLFPKELEIITKISDNRMYQVTGRK